MSQISILPSDVKQRYLKKRRKRIYMLGGIVLLLVFAMTYGLLLLAARIPQVELQALQAQRARVEKQAEALHHYEEMQKEAERAAELLRQALGKNPDWDILFSDLGFSVPPGLWLTDCTAVFVAQSEGTLHLRGWAQSHRLVGELQEGLQEIPWLSDLQIRYSAQATYLDRPHVRFELEARIQPAAPASLTEGGS